MAGSSIPLAGALPEDSLMLLISGIISAKCQYRTVVSHIADISRKNWFVELIVTYN
jgi:hypothetical protein